MISMNEGLNVTTTLMKAALRYRSELVVPETTKTAETVSAPMVAAFLRNVESLGYELTADAIKKIMELDAATFKKWATEVIKLLREVKGANYRYEPMYPNFPKQVADASDEELFVNAIMHYFGSAIGVRIMPVYEKEERFPFYENTKLTVLKLADADVHEDIITRLLEAKISFSDTDVELLRTLCENISAETLNRILDGVTMPNKENFAHVANIVRADKDALAVVLAHANTVTDLLRVGAVFSDAHPSLRDKFRFGKLTRAERRLIVQSLLRLDGNYVEDFNRNREMWKRFTERLHVGEFASADSKLVRALTVLRSSKNITTWGTKMEAALAEADYVTSVDVLSQRPGEFARRLNQLLRGASTDEQEYVLEAFEAVSSKVSTTVLLQVIAHFRTVQKNPSLEFSTLFTKGVHGGAFALPREKSHLSEKTCKKVISIAENALKTIYAERGTLGKVFYDFDGSYNPVVPFGLRNTSNAFRVVGRGTRTQYDAKKVLRFFIYWKDQNGYSVDLDLSAVILDKELNTVGSIGYYNLRTTGILHSGDITSAPKGASEFIDVDYNKLKKDNPLARYVAMTVHSYSQQNFKELDEVLAGFMVREDVGSGEVYEPKSVENAFTLNSATTSVTPMLFDLKNGEAIFTDVALKGNSFVNNARNTSSTNQNLLKGLIGKEFVTYNDVISANLAARAELVKSAEDADMVITLRDGESSINFDDFLAKWL